LRSGGELNAGWGTSGESLKGEVEKRGTSPYLHWAERKQSESLYIRRGNKLLSEEEQFL